MTGLVKKDLYLSVSMFKSDVVVAAVFAALTAFGIYDISFFVTYVSVMCIMIPVNLFAYDEQARWDKYAAALPSASSSPEAKTRRSGENFFSASRKEKPFQRSGSKFLSIS